MILIVLPEMKIFLTSKISRSADILLTLIEFVAIIKRSTAFVLIRGHPYRTDV